MGRQAQKGYKRVVSLIVALAVALTAAVVVGVCARDSKTHDAPTAKDMTLRVKGADLVDVDGKVVLLRGVNIGGLFIQEGWMCPTDMSGLERQDELALRAKLVERFGKERARALLKAYRDAWWTDADFDNVKEAGLNLIRLPFGYFDIEDDEGNVAEFSEIDRFVDECEKREIYLILDLHGGYGSQNGKDHSGDTSGIRQFTEENILKTANLWRAIAKRYEGRGVIAGFDILNEPEGVSGHTDSVQWDAYDVIYQAIRAEDPTRIVIMESVWEVYNLPAPKSYGWKNVVYSYHNYHWGDENINSAERQIAFTDGKIDSYKLNASVPTFVGEFTLFNQRKAWEYAVKAYADNGISFAFWTYKVYAPGGSSWGLYAGGGEKVDPVYDTYEEILRKWSDNVTSERYEYNKLYENLFSKEK